MHRTRRQRLPRCVFVRAPFLIFFCPLSSLAAVLLLQACTDLQPHIVTLLNTAVYGGASGCSFSNTAFLFAATGTQAQYAKVLL